MTSQEDSILLASVAAIPEEGTLEWCADPDGRVSILLFRRGARVFAYHNVCPHQGRGLGIRRSGGQATRFFFDPQGHLVCPHHGAVFQLSDGECLSGPCRGAGLTPVAIRIEGNSVFLDQALTVEE